MKRNILYIALSGVLALASCSDFLDTLPDNRTEIDSADKMAKLLVSAYPTTTYIMLTEMSSDRKSLATRRDCHRSGLFLQFCFSAEVSV